jgi:ABC-2 type transport system ATP-binding protein
MPAMLHLRDIHKRYGKRQVLRGLELELRDGEIYGLLGPNGSGKSTSLKVATGLVHADRGEILIDGIDLGQDRMAALSRVGAQIDAPAFHGYLSGRRNLQLLLAVQDLDPSEADEVLSVVGLADRGEDKVGAYSTVM